MFGVRWFMAVSVCWLLHTTVQADTVQTFDGGGTPFVSNQFGSAPGPMVVGGGPTGNFMRLTQAINSQQNSIGFNRTDLGPFGQIVADWDFRIGGGSRADGYSIAFLNTANFGIAGPYPVPLSGVFEDPNIVGSFGVGFDTFDNGLEGNNSITLHFNGTQRAQNMLPLGVFNLQNNVFNHAHLEITPVGGGGSNVSLVITPNIFGVPGAPVTVYNSFFIPDLNPYESRVGFGARTGGLTDNHDIDNINITFQPQGQPIPEPGTLSLLGLGALGLLACYWRHRRKRSV
jgi:hypothetical protein